ncbi:MAG: hypothetical protein P8P90_04765 [Opitutales bacterium]|jgi:hypothetical protein|nr:hypothetical protein [Opitutales bacterium]
MDSYLKGRGFKDVESGDSNFEGFLEGKSGKPDAKEKNVAEVRPQEKAVIYEEEGCPKVELVSEDGRPTSLVIHLPDGRLLEIDCIY